MANFIRVPLRSTAATAASGPRYGLVNVTDVYDCADGGVVGEHILIYTSLPADTTEVQAVTMEYFANGGGTAVVTAQDISNLRDLIVKANQEPGSNPIFQLIGAATAAAADLEDFQVDAFASGSLPPI